MRGIGRRPYAIALVAGICIAANSGRSMASANHSSASGPATLQSRAVELGLTGSITSIEGVSTALIGVRAGQYRYARSVPVQYALGLSYRRVSDADQLEIEGALSAFFRAPESSTYVFAGVAGSLRQEWIGSFSHDRYALGIDLGVKMLASRSAAGTITYQFRRVLNDPVSNFNEHRLTVGISILFNNAAPARQSE